MYTAGGGGGYVHGLFAGCRSMGRARAGGDARSFAGPRGHFPEESRRGEDGGGGAVSSPPPGEGRLPTGRPSRGTVVMPSAAAHLTKRAVHRFQTNRKSVVSGPGTQTQIIIKNRSAVALYQNKKFPVQMIFTRWRTLPGWTIYRIVWTYLQ